MGVQMAFNPARAIGFLHDHGHTQEQAQAVVEVLQDSQNDLVTKADLTAALDLAMARMEARFTRLLWLQLGAYTAAAVGAIVVAGVLWG